MQFNPKIDAYIDSKSEFAQEILNYCRELVHRTIPDVKETLKWGMPFLKQIKSLF